MQRCLQLAEMGNGSVAPNPMVGAVLVYQDRIIGEGYHEMYGQAHAEVNCLNNVKAADRVHIADSTLYVSLEPCNHFGKTGPCTELIIRERIPRVVIACSDPFEKVNGSGIARLHNAGVEVITGVLEAAAIELNRRFFTFHQQQRPYIILKWAESKNHCIAAADGSPVKISNALTDKLVHRWRSEEASIMVGTNTALRDNPSLTNRHYTGNQPLRILLDNTLKVPRNFQLYQQTTPLLILNSLKEAEEAHCTFQIWNQTLSLPEQLGKILYNMQKNSVIIEGGSKLLQTFIRAGAWDEARIIRNQSLLIENGLPAPEWVAHQPEQQFVIGSDEISIFRNKSTLSN
jgi:diaminohydroxyphosphoribosylaminopyrimidine deaminase/5-amino-6-(5-phosphoribosylamino)uracil reductase